MFLDSIYFDDFEAFLSENDLLEHFGITSTLGRFTSDSPCGGCVKGGVAQVRASLSNDREM